MFSSVNWPIEFKDFAEIEEAFIDKEYWQGALAYTAHLLETPVSLFIIKKNDIVLFRSLPIEGFENNHTCKIFHQLTFENGTTGKSYCDIFGANLVKDIINRFPTIERLKNAMQYHYNKRPYEFSDNNGLNFEIPYINFENGLLHYCCPMLSFIKIGCPMTIDGKIVGFLFAGRVKRIKFSKTIKRRIGKFFKSIECNNSSFLKLLCDNWKNEKLMSLGDFINISKRLESNCDKLNKRLKYKLYNYRKSYIDDRVQNNYYSYLMEKAPKITTGTTQEIKELWSAVNHICEQVRRDFSIKSIVVFGIKELGYFEDDVRKLEVVARSGYNINTNIVYNLNKIGDYEKFEGQVISSLAKSNVYNPQRLFDGIENINDRIDKESNHVRLLKTSKQNILVVWASADIDKWDFLGRKLEDDDIRLEFEKKISSIYLSIAFRYSVMANKILRNYLRRSVTILDHEIVQRTATISLEKDTLFKIVGDFTGNNSLIKNVNDSIDINLKEIARISKQSILLSYGNLELNRMSFKPLKELLFTWKRKRNESFASFFDIHDKYYTVMIPQIKNVKDHESYPDVYADLNLIHHVTQNIIINAVKYCHDFTKIYLDCMQTDNGFFIFRCKDYGISIPEIDEEKIFDFDYRINNQKEVEGRGIGLYLARRIIEAHGGKIYVERSKVLSGYNIGLFSSFLGNNDLRQHELYNSIKDEYEKLNSASSLLKYSDIVDVNLFDKRSFGKYEILDNIKKETSEVIITFNIPSSTEWRNS